MNESTFFQDLAVLMAVAGIVTVVFSRLKWPKVIGYLLAGILMSKNTFGGSFLVNEQSIYTIGQLGIVFLMLTLGLEFSASDMKRSRRVAFPTALFDTVMMVWLGYTVGRDILGWGNVPSLFLGAAICDSATTLLAKTIDEMKWSHRPFVRYIFGTTICEDILCVGVIALITGVAHGRGMSAVSVGVSLGGLGLFFAGVLVFGLLAVPRILNYAAKSQDDETLLLALLGCCFLVSWVAFRLEYSLALGAFLMGVLGACSDVRMRLHRLAEPLRSMFSAVFFVTIGLLVDPLALAANWGAVLLLAGVVVAGKFLNCFAMSILAGQSVKNAVQTGMGLAQIGEFAYMVALLYVTETGDSVSPMYQIVVGVSLVTTCLNPAMLRLSDPFGDWCERHTPAFVRGWLSAYCSWQDRFRERFAASGLRESIRSHLAVMGSIMVLEVAVAIGASMLPMRVFRMLGEFFVEHKGVFLCAVVNLCCVIMFATYMGVSRILAKEVAEVITRHSEKGGRWRAEAARFVRFAVRSAAFVIGFAEILMINVNWLPQEKSVRIVIGLVLAAVALVFWKRMREAGRHAGRELKAALDSERRAPSDGDAPALSVPGDFYEYLTVAAGSNAVGKDIRSLDIRAKTGASVVGVERNGEKSRNPGPTWIFAEGDVVAAIGEPAQLDAFRELMK